MSFRFADRRNYERHVDLNSLDGNLDVPSTLGENFSVNFEAQRLLENSTTDEHWFRGPLTASLDRLAEVTGDDTLRSNPQFPQGGGTTFSVGQLEAKLEAQADLIAKLGDPEIKSAQQIRDEVSEQTKQLEERRNFVNARAGWGGWAAGFGGAMLGAMMDPPNLLSLPLGAAAGASTASKIGAQALINAGIEVPIQLSVAEFKEKTGLEHSDAQAVFNVLGAAAGGAAFESLGLLGGKLARKLGFFDELDPEQRVLVDVIEELERVAAERNRAIDGPPAKPIDVGEIGRVFGVDDEQATAVAAIVEAAGLDPERILVGKGDAGELARADLLQRTKPIEEIRNRVWDEMHSFFTDAEKAVSPDPTRAVDGREWIDVINRSEAGPGLPEGTTGKQLAELMDAAAERAGLHPDLRAKIKIADVKKWDEAFRLPTEARYWYELSAHAFGKGRFQLSRELTERLIDVIAGTSGGSDPFDNLKSGIASLAQELQGKPITVGLREPGSLTKALSPEPIASQKFGNFSLTMQMVAGFRKGRPLPTVDLQMAKFYGLKESEVAGNPVMYQALAHHMILVRDLLNANLKEGEQPFESWQVQAMAWVRQRNEKLNDDYDLSMPKIMKILSDAGVPLKDGKVTIETLMDPRTVTALTPTARTIGEGPTATIETVTLLDEIGRETQELRRLIAGSDAKFRDKALREYDAIVRRSMAALGQRRKKEDKLSLLSELMAVLADETKTDITRIDWRAAGTFEGDPNLNMRVPFLANSGKFALDPKLRPVFMSIIGKHRKQAGMAWSTFETVDPDAPGRNTFSVFIRRYDRALPDQALMSQLEAAVGRPINGARVPNGWVYDFNVGGMEPLTDAAAVQKAVAAVLGEDHNWSLLDRVSPQEKGAGGYIDGSEYDGHIRRFKDGLRRKANREAGRGVGDTEQRLGDLRRIEAAIADTHKTQQAQLKVWLDEYGRKADKAGLRKTLAQRTRDGGEVKGSTRFLEDGAAVVRAFEKSDVSTAMHELAHVFRRQLFDKDIPLAERAGVTDAMIDTAEKFAGVKDGKWTTAAEEKFARGFERYLREGKAPTKALRDVFRNFQKWLTKIYRRLKGSELADAKVSPEMREVFDELLRRSERGFGGPKPREHMANLQRATEAVIAGKHADIEGVPTSASSPGEPVDLGPAVAARDAGGRATEPNEADMIAAVDSALETAPDAMVDTGRLNEDGSPVIDTLDNVVAEHREYGSAVDAIIGCVTGGGAG